VLRADFSPGRPRRSAVIRGSEAVARQAKLGTLPGALVLPALVNGAAGVVIATMERPVAIMGFTVRDGRIVEIDSIGDPERAERLAAGVLAHYSPSGDSAPCPPAGPRA
jgi:hypothetical protein